MTRVNKKYCSRKCRRVEQSRRYRRKYPHRYPSQEYINEADRETGADIIKWYDGVCLHCGKDFRGSNQLRKYCSRKCQRKAHHTRWLKKNPDYHNEYKRKLRAKILDLYGTECAHCDESNPIVLGLDHKKPIGQKRRNTYHLYSKILVHKEDKEYLSHFQLLCRNCNWIKLINNNEREILKNGSERPEPISYDVQARAHILYDGMEEV